MLRPGTWQAPCTVRAQQSLAVPSRLAAAGESNRRDAVRGRYRRFGRSIDPPARLSDKPEPPTISGWLGLLRKRRRSRPREARCHMSALAPPTFSGIRPKSRPRRRWLQSVSRWRTLGGTIPIRAACSKANDGNVRRLTPAKPLMPRPADRVRSRWVRGCL